MLEVYVLEYRFEETVESKTPCTDFIKNKPVVKTWVDWKISQVFTSWRLATATMWDEQEASDKQLVADKERNPAYDYDKWEYRVRIYVPGE